MKKKAKKLVLAKETVRDLMNSEGLKAAVGGLPTYTPTCGGELLLLRDLLRLLADSA